MSRKTPSTKVPEDRTDRGSRSLVAPSKDQLPAILEAVRTSLDKRELPVFRIRDKQDAFLNAVEMGLEFYGSRSEADINRTAMQFKVFEKLLDQLSGVLAGFRQVERVVLDIAAERAFKAMQAGVEEAAKTEFLPSRYGRTDGASMLARVEVDGWNTGFILDQFQVECTLLTRAAGSVVASNPERPPSKKHHVEPNVEHLIAFLGRMWKEIFNETPSPEPGAAFGLILNTLLSTLGIREVGARTLKRILSL